MNLKQRTDNTVHIAGRGLVVHQLRILVSQFHVLRTGTLSEIRPDNMYQTVGTNIKKMKLRKYVRILLTVLVLVSCTRPINYVIETDFNQLMPDTIDGVTECDDFNVEYWGNKFHN